MGVRVEAVSVFASDTACKQHKSLKARSARSGLFVINKQRGASRAPAGRTAGARSALQPCALPKTHQARRRDVRDQRGAQSQARSALVLKREAGEPLRDIEQELRGVGTRGGGEQQGHRGEALHTPADADGAVMQIDEINFSSRH